MLKSATKNLLGWVEPEKGENIMTNDTAALNAAKEKLKSAGIEFIQVEVTELDGAQRGKLVTLDKGLGGDVGFSSVLFGLTTADDVWESPFTSFENGFLDYFARPQAETVRVLPWRDATASVICDFTTPMAR